MTADQLAAGLGVAKTTMANRAIPHLAEAA